MGKMPKCVKFPDDTVLFSKSLDSFEPDKREKNNPKTDEIKSCSEINFLIAENAKPVKVKKLLIFLLPHVLAVF